MARLAQIACAATVVVATAATPARADPINILSGSAFIESPGGDAGFANFVGTRGFSLTARAGISSPRGLFLQCFSPECTPGTRIDFDLGLSGASEALDGVMTIEGDQYPVNDSVDPVADAFLLFDGSFIAPAAARAQVTLSTPFSLTGRAIALTPLHQIAHNDELFGHGVATVALVTFPPQAGFPPSWMVDSVRFDFAQPTPESSTLLLLATCVFGVAGARFRRPSKRRPTTVGAGPF